MMMIAFNILHTQKIQMDIQDRKRHIQNLDKLFSSQKISQGYCQPNKDSICNSLPLHTHDEDHFHHPQI